MKKIILNKEKETIKLSELKDHKWDWDYIATKITDSNSSDEIYFLVGNTPHQFYFSNLRGFALGSGEYKSMEEAIKARIEGTDCACEPSEVFVFKNLKEVIKKLGV